MRLQKFLASRGVASRRAAESLIAAGRVSVNGTPVSRQGVVIDPASDTVSVDGKAIAVATSGARTIILNKPRGYVCSADPKDGRTIYELLEGVPERVMYAGRLDRNSEGVVILSTDGDLVLRLTHPRFGHEKSYRVTVSGVVDGHVLERLNAPMEIEGYRTRPARVSLVREGGKGGRVILDVVLREGRHRQIREMCRQCGLSVHRLVRIAVGGISLKGLRPGEWRDLSNEEMDSLRLQADGDLPGCPDEPSELSPR